MVAACRQGAGKRRWSIENSWTSDEEERARSIEGVDLRVLARFDEAQVSVPRRDWPTRVTKVPCAGDSAPTGTSFLDAAWVDRGTRKGFGTCPLLIPVYFVGQPLLLVSLSVTSEGTLHRRSLCFDAAWVISSPREAR